MKNNPDNLKLTENADPLLEALLGEALAPRNVAGGVPRDLVADVLALTEPKLRPRRGGVLAYLNELVWPRTLAALLVLAAWAGLVFTSATIVQQARAWVNLSQELPVVLAEVNQPTLLVSPTPLTALDDQSRAIDRDLSALESELGSAERARTF